MADDTKPNETNLALLNAQMDSLARARNISGRTKLCCCFIDGVIPKEGVLRP